MPLGSKKLGAFRNKYNSGTSSTFTPSVTITESHNTSAITYTISSNITTEPTFYYDISGNNFVSSNFTDATLADNFTLDANGSATITKLITNTNTNSTVAKDFQINIKTSSLGRTLTTGNVYNLVSYEPIQYTYTSGTAPANITVNSINYKLFTWNANVSTEGLQFIRAGSNANAEVQVLAVGGGGGGGPGYRLYESGVGLDYQCHGASGGGGEVVLSNINISTLPLNTTPTVVVGTGGATTADSSNVHQRVTANASNGTNTTISWSNVSVTAIGGNGANGTGWLTTPGSYYVPGSGYIYYPLWGFDGGNIYNQGGDGGDSGNASSGGGIGGDSYNNLNTTILPPNTDGDLGANYGGTYSWSGRTLDFTGSNVEYAAGGRARIAGADIIPAVAPGAGGGADIFGQSIFTSGNTPTVARTNGYNGACYVRIVDFTPYNQIES